MNLKYITFFIMSSSILKKLLTSSLGVRAWQILVDIYYNLAIIRGGSGFLKKIKPPAIFL